MRTKDIIGKKYLKYQALFTGVACLLCAAIFNFSPVFPHYNELSPVLFTAGLGYLCFFFCFDRCGGYLYRAVMAMSLMGITTLAFVVHVTGGIASPLVCFYFALLISEVGYGVSSPVTVYAAVASYLCVMLGEASGLIKVPNPQAAAVYASPPIFIFIVLAVVSYMVITAHIGKIILGKLKRDFEEEQRQKRALLARYSELGAHSQIGLLTHGIIHDLRSPLTAALVSLEMKNADGSAVGEAAEIDRELADALKALAAKLDSIARYGRVVQEGAREKLPLRETLDAVVAMADFLPVPYKVAVKKDYGVDDGLHVLADKIDLQQIYFNLVRNAVEAVGAVKGEKVLEVRLRKAGAFAEITVSDNGAGFPPALLGSGLKKGFTTKEDGTGVGLLLAGNLTEKYGGKLVRRNREGQNGAKVVTTLPIQE